MDLGDNMTQRERMEKGMIYDPADPDLTQEQKTAIRLQNEYNATGPFDGERRKELLKEMLGACGEGCHLEPPFYANWGGRHVYLKDRVYANFGLTCVDDADIRIGNNVMFGPHVVLTTANHTIDPQLRLGGYQYARDIVIEDNVWIGANVTVLPGVHIGQNSVIGAGSVVTKDIPENTVAMGIPCRPVRRIGQADNLFYDHGKRIDWEVLEEYDNRLKEERTSARAAREQERKARMAAAAEKQKEESMNNKIVDELKGMSREERAEYFRQHKSELLDSDLQNVSGGRNAEPGENMASEVPYDGNWYTSRGFICEGQVQC